MACSALEIAVALAKFQEHLTVNYGQPINLTTIGAFAECVSGISEACEPEDEKKK